MHTDPHCSLDPHALVLDVCQQSLPHFRLVLRLFEDLSPGQSAHLIRADNDIRLVKLLSGPQFGLSSGHCIVLGGDIRGFGQVFREEGRRHLEREGGERQDTETHWRFRGEEDFLGLEEVHSRQ